MHSSAEAVLTEAGREYWRGVLVAGGFIAIPGGPAIRSPGVAVHDVAIPEDLVAASHQLADALDDPAQFGAVGCPCQGALRAVRRAPRRDRVHRWSLAQTVAVPADD